MIACQIKRRIYSIVVLLFLNPLIGFGQETGSFKIPDSLKDKSYDEIYGEFIKVNKDTIKSLVYLKTFLRKGKQEDEETKIAYAYGLLSHYEKKNKTKLQYLDSAVAITKNSRDPSFPALPYSLKGAVYYFKQDFKKALYNFFLSLDAAKKNDSDFYKYAAKRNIGLIKSKLGKYDEALKSFKECIQYNYNVKTGIQDTINYLFVTLDISETFSKKKMLDSSSLYGEEGIRVSKKVSYDPYNFYYHFIFNEGVNDFYRKNFSTAKDSIHKALPFLSNNIDKNYILKAYLYLGRIHDEIDEQDKARIYYQKLDSVYQTSSTVSYEVREAYNALVKYYKDKKDIKNQLLYIEKLLQFDSILQNDYKELNDILVKQYDTPQLLAEKERLVQEANTKSSRYGSYIIVLIGSVILFIGLFSYQYYRRRLYQKRFEVLTQKKDTTQEIKEEVLIKEKEISTKDIGISSTIIEEVLAKLNEFEEKRGFVSTKITLTNLSSSLVTNNKYLSKIINVYKEKSFSQYINDLRIDYIVERLQEDKKLRNYTIKAIARETGFNTAEVFSKAFYGKHGIYPSYFIKKLEKLNNS